MNIQNNNVTIQLNVKNLQGKNLRIADCDKFLIRVFTDNPAMYLSFSGRNFLATEFVDEITIPVKMMEMLNSGVVQYTYHYTPKTISNRPQVVDLNKQCPHHHFHFDEDRMINGGPVVTSIFWTNIKSHEHNHHPANGANMSDIQKLHHLIDKVKFNAERVDEDLQNQILEEVQRATAKEVELSELIDSLQSVTDTIIEDNTTKNDEVDSKIEETTNQFNEKIEELVKALETEVTERKNADVDVLNSIKTEETNRISADEILSTQITMEKERAQAQETNLSDRIASVSEKFESFKEIQTEALKSEIERAKESESGLNRLIQNTIDNLNAEISRGSQKDIEHQNLVETEANRAKAVENKIQAYLQTEIERATDKENHILTEVHTLQDTVSNLATATNVYTKSETDNKINQVKNDLSTLENTVNNHINEVYTKVEVDNKVSDINGSIAKLESDVNNHLTTSNELSEKVSGLVGDMDKAKSDILNEIAKCDAENNKISTDLQTLSDSVYTKAETDNIVNDLSNSISTLENWRLNHVDNTEGLQEKVSKLITDTEKLSTDLSVETTNRINADTTLQTKVDIVEGKIDAEEKRAKESEKLINDSIDEIKSNSTSKHTELAENIAEVQADLTLGIAERKASDKVFSDALEIVNGDSSTNGSIKKSLQDAKDYTNSVVASSKLQNSVELNQTLLEYAKLTEVDKKIQEVIGTAPEALSTLGQIASVLSQDNDAISAINEVLSGKANSEDVYNKNEIDSQVTTINNSIATEITNRTNSDVTINGRIDDLVTKVNGIETNVDSNNSTLSDAITAEGTARKAQDKVISDKLDSEIEKLIDKVNELNAKVIADIADSSAKDTEIEANITATNTLLANVETKVDNEVIRATEKDAELTAKDVELEAKIQANTDNINSEIARSKQVEKELNDKINSINLSDTNSNVSALNDALNAEISRATAVETTLTNSINDEVQRSKQAEKELNDKIDAIEIPTVDFTEVNNAISTLETNVNNSISTLETKVDNEITTARANEKANADNISTLQSSVSSINDSVSSLNADLTQFKADSNAQDTEIINSINVEKNRAENAEKALEDKIAIINGDSETIGSIAHSVDDVKHYVEDNYQPKGDYLTEHQSLDNYYTKSQVNQKIEAIDVSDQLKDYVKSEDNSVITDENGNIISKIIIDFSDEEEAERIYTKVEADSKFATKEELEAVETGNVDLSNYYTKSQVDSKIANIDIPETDLSNYYDKSYINGVVSEVNTKLNSKLPIDSFNEWSENVALKSEIPDVSNFAEKSETYSKTEVDNLINNIIKTYTEEEFEALTDEEKNNGIIIVL